MKIGLFHLNLSTESGDPRMFLSMAKTLQESGHEITIYTAALSPDCFPRLARGLDIRVIPSKVPLNTLTGGKTIFEKIVRRIQKFKNDIDIVSRLQGEVSTDFETVIFQNDESYRLGLFYKKMRPEIKTVWIMNNTPFYSSQKRNPLVKLMSLSLAWRAKRLVRHYLKGIDLVIVHDDEHKKVFEEFKVPLHILRIPVDFQSFYVPVKQRQKGTTTTQLLGVGSLSRARRFEDILQAAEMLRAKNHDVRVEIVCKDFWHDTVLREELTSLSNQPNLKGAVTFHFAGVGEEELRAIQKKSDIFIFPNIIPIWGMAALEAMAAGLPLVVSRATTIAEVLEDGTHALFTEPAQPADIARQVLKLIENPEEYNKIGVSGQAFVKEHLSGEGYAASLLRLISQSA